MAIQTDEQIVTEAQTRFRQCSDWEAEARRRFEYDTKFANGDAHNLYQWDTDVVTDRRTAKKPVLTVNKTAQHNLMVINDSKQNKPGVKISPVGDEASYASAQIFQEIVRHIEYISNAENVYDNATTFQVQGGIGYWCITTDYIDDKSFDQEIYIKPIRDPRSVYLDPDINEQDGSDARFGFIFDDMPRDLFTAKHPDATGVGWSSTFSTTSEGWYTQNHVRVAIYYRKSEIKKKLVGFVVLDDKRQEHEIIKYYDELDDIEKAMFNQIKSNEKSLPPNKRTYNERNVLTADIECFKIAGNKIIDRYPWLGKYIPIVRLVGTETIIDGQLDRKGHTRSMIDPQKIYNYNTSANTEFGALQTKAPWVVPAKAIEGYEDYWKVANLSNFAYLPYNHKDDDDENPIPAPTRPAPPQASPGYVQALQIAQNEMMMASGQYQAQFGENENAKSGIAINARQRQGDRATYHFIDNQAIAVRFTGKIIIDLAPKIYDTERVMRISASDGTKMRVQIKPEHNQAYEEVENGGQPMMDGNQQIKEVIFNPNVGRYEIIADTGPSFATRRQEAFNALTQIAAQNKEFMMIAGDILWKVADFPEAAVLAERYRRVIPKNITGDDDVDPQVQQAMQEMQQALQTLQAQLADMDRQLKDKDRELSIKEGDLELRRKGTAVKENREDYKAETDRVVAFGNAGPGISPDQLKPVLKELIESMLAQGNPGIADNANGQDDEEPPVEGAQKAPDGNWYVQDPDRPGQWAMVQDEAEAA